MAAKQVMKGATKRKAKVFSILLLCSILAWLISKLSETYTEKITFELAYSAVPDSLQLMKSSKDKLSMTLQGTGWQFLGSRFSSGKIDLDLSRVESRNGSFYIREQNFREQIAAKIPQAMKIVQLDSDTLYFEFSKLVSKKVPVSPAVSLQLSQNYLLDGDLKLEPDSVLLKGPLQEIDTIEMIMTQPLELKEVENNFERNISLVKPAALEHTVFSNENVKVSGEVFRFSEKILQVPVEVINLPENTQIRTFPNTVEVLCKARLERLKDLTPSDFRIVADLTEVKEDSSFLPLHLILQPEDIPSIQLLQLRVEFILKRE